MELVHSLKAHRVQAEEEEGRESTKNKYKKMKPTQRFSQGKFEMDKHNSHGKQAMMMGLICQGSGSTPPVGASWIWNVH